MKISKILSILFVVAILLSMVLSANAYTVKDNVTASNTGSKTTNASGTTYVYDFKAADGSLADSSKYATTSNATFTVDKNGLSFKTNGGGLGDQNKLANSIIDANIYDPDFSLGSTSKASLTLEAGHYYEITVVWQSGTAGKYMGLVRTSSTSSTFAGTSTVCATVTGRANSQKATAANTDMTDTFIIDGDGSTLGSANAGNMIGLGGNASTTFLFKSITVTVYDKSAFTGADNQLTINFDNGLKDIYVPRTDINNGGTLEIAEDPTNTGNGNVLKMTTTKASVTTFQFGLATKPGLGTYAAAGGNKLPGVDGYQVTLGNIYRISFDVYCGDYEEGIAGSYACYLSSQAGIGTVGNKTPQNKWSYKNVDTETLQSGAGNGKWIHVEYNITTASDADDQTYLLIGLANITPNATNGTKDYAAVVYFDNIVVTDVTKTNYTNFVDNTKRSIRAESGTGADYISAGIRFRGEIATATANAAEEVGFIVAPEQYVTAYTGTTAWYDMSSGKPAMASAQSIDTTNVIYGTNGNNNQYQLLLRGLTQQNATVDLKDTYFTVMMYLKDSDGNYTYYNVATSSYREIQNAYIANDPSNASKY